MYCASSLNVRCNPHAQTPRCRAAQKPTIQFPRRLVTSQNMSSDHEIASWILPFSSTRPSFGHSPPAKRSPGRLQAPTSGAEWGCVRVFGGCRSRWPAGLGGFRGRLRLGVRRWACWERAAVRVAWAMVSVAVRDGRGNSSGSCLPASAAVAC